MRLIRYFCRNCWKSCWRTCFLVGRIVGWYDDDEDYFWIIVVMMEGRPMMMMGQLMPLGLDGVGISFYLYLSCFGWRLCTLLLKRLQLLNNEQCRS